MVIGPYTVVEQFEQALCEYTGAKYAVTTTSCTMAILLACAWLRAHRYRWARWGTTITLPSRTYIGVPMSVVHAGWKVRFDDIGWEGGYLLAPTHIVDSARLFTSNMYQKGEMRCVSFHWTKHLAIGQGGAILHDNEEADAWLRRARFDGRTEGSDAEPTHLGYHAYMMPRDAAEGLSRLAVLPRHNEPLPNDDYPDLSKMEVFK